ncbi:hypothetical protein FA95DRAFT_1578166 [Auriscalpium vulgare]|uniref:Uncharacterized protein n=1 Tax=Auriscalpium vulgare TaxID=40419 RepID=A0ACB8R3E5_9AGAM|nr:hypothetical protein FA95DRAFT_1578166 [Auriscalpium vulgare]
MNPIASPVLHIPTATSLAPAPPLPAVQPLPTPPSPESAFSIDRSQWIQTPLPIPPSRFQLSARTAADRLHSFFRPYKFRLERLYWNFFPPNLDNPVIMVHSDPLSKGIKFRDPFAWRATCRPAEQLFIGAKVLIVISSPSPSPFTEQLKAVQTGIVLAMRGVGPKRIQLILGPNNGQGPLDYLEVERAWVRIPLREWFSIALSSSGSVDPLAHYPVAEAEVADVWTGTNCVHIQNAARRRAQME